MTTQSTPQPNRTASLGALLLLATLGLGIVFASGHVQAHAIHDAAHDMRHALGFPCH